MVIDSHCHYGRGDGLTGPWDTSAKLDLYLRRADEAGINRTVLFSTFHTDYPRANREVAAMCKRFPNRFYGYAFVNPVRDRGHIKSMVREAVEEFGFVGIKLHRYDGHISREVCDAASEYRLPVLYDVMGEISTVDLLAEEYPGINFIIPHLSTFADGWKAQKSFIDKLVRYPNIYTDSSSVLRFDLLVEAVKRAGAHKILFGSDGPWLHPGLELAKISALKLSSEHWNRITSQNFLELIPAL